MIQARRVGVLGRLLLLASLGCFGWALWQLFLVPAGFWSGLRPGLFLLSLGGWLGLVFLMAALWMCLLRSLDATAPPVRVLAGIFAAGWLGRYLPGKVGLIANKVLLCEQCGTSRRQALASVAAEQVLFLGTGGLVVLWLVPLLPMPAGLEKLVPLLPWLAAGAQLILLGALAIALVLTLRRFGQAPLRPLAALGVSLGYVGAHLSAGIGLWWLCQAMQLGAVPEAVTLTAMLAMAHLAGIAALFAPGGIGVREAVLTGLLAPTLGLEAAVALAVVARVWATLGDIAALGLLTIISRRPPQRER